MARQPTRRTTSADLARKLEQIDRQIIQSLEQRCQTYQELVRTLPARRQTATEWTRVARPNAALWAGTRLLSPTAYGIIFREIAGACRLSLKSLRVGFLGPWHSYSHLAAVKHFGSSTEWVPLPSIDSAFEEVAQQQIDYAIVPLENSTDGRVVDTLSTFIRLPVKICAEVALQVRHCLLGKGTRAEVQRVLSKPQALSQCRHWLASHLPTAEFVAAPSTAAAAEAASGDATIAAIASRAAATEYELRILAEHIEDQPDNMTRFAVLGTESAARTGRDKTAILFQISHEPGALADAMAIFKRNRLNLTWIESFPTGRSAGRQEYMFFLEFEGHERELRSRKALAALAKKTQRLDILGSFPQSDSSVPEGRGDRNAG